VPPNEHWIDHHLVPALRSAAGRPCIGEAAPSRGPAVLDLYEEVGLKVEAGSRAQEAPALEPALGMVAGSEGGENDLTLVLATSSMELACLVLEACLLPRGDPHPLLDRLGLSLAGRAGAQDLTGASVPALKHLGPHTCACPTFPSPFHLVSPTVSLT
jgi:hypothetical protein